MKYLAKEVAELDVEEAISVIQPEEDVGLDNKKYLMIHFPGFIQNVTSVECLSNQLCKKRTCQQDFKLHQFLTVPHDKLQFELNELRYRFFNIPNGCKCVA